MHRHRNRHRNRTSFARLALALAAAVTAAASAAAGCVELDGTAEAELLAPRGLSAEYFRGGTPDPHQRVLARIDPSIDFTWAWGAPDPALPADGFSVRWSGTLEPRFSEVHALTVHADDAARVWIDGALVIDYRNVFTPATANVALTAGRRHQLVVEYTESWLWAAMQLEWSSSSQPREIVPASQLAPAPTPPAQPLAGPGGATYPHGGCTQTKRPIWWNDDLSYWVFEPASPAPASANLVVFDHGWMGNDPVHYAHWLDHLCRKGNVVIFPRYQQLLTLPGFFTPNAIWSVKDALAWLATPNHVRPRVEDGMVVVGHSAGGTVAANMADEWQANGLPFPRALFAVEPATDIIVPYTSLAQIPASTRVACWVGNDDDVVGRTGCDTIFTRATQVPGKRYVWHFSDDHGAPGLVADHFQPSELTGYTDALDYLGTWRFADAMIDCAWRGTSCGIGAGAAAGPTIDLGAWSDGTPVTPARVTIDALPACPPGSRAIGC